MCLAQDRSCRMEYEYVLTVWFVPFFLSFGAIFTAVWLVELLAIDLRWGTTIAVICRWSAHSAGTKCLVSGLSIFRLRQEVHLKNLEAECRACDSCQTDAIAMSSDHAPGSYSRIDNKALMAL